MPQPPRSDSARHVFVYGTLRRGGSNDITRLDPPPVPVGTAAVPGVLYDLGAYPGIALTGPASEGEGRVPVLGEVYAITSALERCLDRIEEVWPEPSGEYVKREVMVCLKESGAELSCLVYEISPAFLRGAPRLLHGDWMASR
ncbi:gamma-glutamylcyclotransferase family protein [Paracidovorax citrulli]|uniref:gamma-glutamylcyclotransferase family protein n=1 Tax=Paracidovorax citrulli TaxID=80869 RepID=UPI0002EEF98B|nr:gamma-glutamylcyclotransferase family protein [Paracidovorax citrulli]QCX12789.1 hypothetical protein APS58_4083 [Paracidovorax citrulli]UEG44246.1 gamma-glutamylcyclotransferase [Paracidovorax citrulli]UMT88424.1 gamma-glutamylcyclotransferase [Paracidovorax citrulli]UMT96886.1 gamma-glutamylcyclotransferase [Paracidovorax citrulli]WIY32666.1 gamma-glutamylcyclotransferase family protein [Paracidovorax citrulli]